VIAFVLLVAAGIGAGIVGTVAGLASLVSYPALLAFGLPPLAANVSNTTAMTAVGVGSFVGAREELRGHGRRVAVLGAVAGAGAALGAVLLLAAPASTFEAVVPWLVALGALLLLFRDTLRTWAERRRRGEGRGDRRTFGVALTGAGVYSGYFGAGAGIIVLALLSLRYSDSFHVSNAMKTLVTGVGNLVATALYVVVAPVSWTAVVPISLGMLVGGVAGPRIARRLPERGLRVVIGLMGLGLALWLAR
jgi:uncharacterized membrane protein YfcA